VHVTTAVLRARSEERLVRLAMSQLPNGTPLDADAFRRRYPSICAHVGAGCVDALLFVAQREPARIDALEEHLRLVDHAPDKKAALAAFMDAYRLLYEKYGANLDRADAPTAQPAAEPPTRHGKPN
jgi:hypothetical protein